MTATSTPPTIVNKDIVAKAVAEYNEKDNTKPKKGRKAREEDEYISSSLLKIGDLQKRLIDEKDTLTLK